MKFNTLAALWLGKLSGSASRLFGRGGGTAFPGVIAASIDRGLVRSLSSQIKGGSILVTGTNGKTTTSRMIATVLRQNSVTPICNPSGSNLMRGIFTALLQQSDLLGRIRPHGQAVGVFEVDEAVLPYAITEVKPRVVAICNLFRDQLDRYGEVDSVAAVWRESLARLDPDALVVLNADDPIVADVGRGLKNKVVYFGIDDCRPGHKWLEHAADSKWCPHCGLEYEYTLSYYGHIGHYFCPRCDYRRPVPEVSARSLSMSGFKGTVARVNMAGDELELKIGLPGIYNVYNALAAATIAYALGVPQDKIREGIEGFTAAFGRVERLEARGRTLYLVLAKNPVGFNQSLGALLSDERPKNLLLALNDQIADGQDVSWIWDVDFERLAGRLKLLVVSGLRAEDMALRLKYAGVLDDNLPFFIEGGLRQAIDLAIRETPVGETLYIMPTYTAMLDARAILARAGYLKNFWERE